MKTITEAQAIAEFRALGTGWIVVREFIHRPNAARLAKYDGPGRVLVDDPWDDSHCWLVLEPAPAPEVTQ